MPQSGTVALLFTHIVESGDYELSDDEARDNLYQIHHKLMTGAIDAGGGQELQWLGDGVLASFSSTADAVRSAINMQQSARRMDRSRRVELQIGVHLGEVLRRQEGYFGTPLVVARRLCDLADSGQIVCSAMVADVLSSRQMFRFESLGDIKLKGIEQPMGVCEVLYERNDPGAMINQTPFVGRAQQLARLTAKLDEAVRGTGSIAMVRGEPGIGKSRMLEEFSDQARASGAIVLRGASYDGEWQAPYGPFAEAILAYSQTVPASDLAAALGSRAGIVARIAPRVRELLGDLPEPVVLDKDEERVRLFDAVSQVLIAISKTSPLVLILDDLHWADRGTVALLNHVSRFTESNPIFLIGAYRDAEVGRAHPLSPALAAFSRAANFEAITLSGLQREELASLLKIIGDDDAPTDLIEAFNHATEGNPLFFRELLLHLFEEGKILQQGSGWNARLKVEELGIPEGVRQVIGRRLLRLSEDANRLLSVASAFNGSFDIDVAASVAGLSESAALNAIDEALDSQLLRPGAGADAFDFTHALIRHTLYSELNPARRTRMHRRIAEQMERAWSEGTSAHAAELAYQFWRGASPSHPARGAEYAIAAADNAEAAYAHDEVGAFLGIALELLNANDPRRAGLLGRRASALAWTLNPDEALELAREAGQLVGREGPEAAAAYYEQTARTLLSAGCTRAAWEMAAEGLKHHSDTRDFRWASLTEIDTFRKEAADPENPGIRIDSIENRELYTVLKSLPREQLDSRNFEIPFESRDEVISDTSQPPRALLMLAGDFRRSLPMQQLEAAEDEQRGAIARATRGWSDVARCHFALGNFNEGRAALDRAVKLSARMTTPSSVGLLSLVAAEGEMHYATDDGWEQMLANSAAVSFIQGPGAESKWASAMINAYASYLLAQLGQTEMALERVAMLPAALERGAPWDRTYTSMACVAVATMWMLNSNAHAEMFERNIRLKVLAPDFRAPVSDGRLSLARLCALQGRYDDAAVWFAQARRVLDEQGARPLRAITDFDESLMCIRAETPGKALALLDNALEQFRRLGMTGWLRRGEQLQLQLRAAPPPLASDPETDSPPRHKQIYH
ncbi:MAG TPA: AAA family ATPase [Candidatus Binataceae bacterium]|nr:AAA family ATPase [Candidatus Binataceae bacterium]